MDIETKGLAAAIQRHCEAHEIDPETCAEMLADIYKALYVYAKRRREQVAELERMYAL